MLIKIKNIIPITFLTAEYQLVGNGQFEMGEGEEHFHFGDRMFYSDA